MNGNGTRSYSVLPGEPGARKDVMTERLATLSDEQFAELWNEAAGLNETAEKVRTTVGRVPR